MANVNELELEQEPLVDSDLKEEQIIVNENEVQLWLNETVRLPQYYNAFVNNGYTSLHIIKGITSQQDLIDIGIHLKGHQVKIMTEIKLLKNSVNQPVFFVDRVLSDWEENDDPLCLYICAAMSLLIPLVGFVTMCCFSCGTNINGRRKRRAFVILVICTISGIVLDIIFSVLMDRRNIHVSLA
eukprot:62150_1